MEMSYDISDHLPAAETQEPPLPSMLCPALAAIPAPALLSLPFSKVSSQESHPRSSILSPMVKIVVFTDLGLQWLAGMKRKATERKRRLTDGHLRAFSLRANGLSAHR
jgi:hypothetical protein